jgi:hypothetical protein
MSKALIILVGTLLVAASGGCSSTPQEAAASLATNTGRLNDELASLTKSRRQIELARARLTGTMELSTLTVESRTKRRVAEWRVLSVKGNVYETRVSLMEAIRQHVQQAADRDAAMLAAAQKLSEATAKAEGSRSSRLSDAAKKLVALSVNRSLTDQVNFLVGYFGSVQDAIKKAKEDAKSAAGSVSAKSDEAQKKAGKPAS